jgi:hypothetical protein
MSPEILAKVERNKGMCPWYQVSIKAAALHLTSEHWRSLLVILPLNQATKRHEGALETATLLARRGAEFL